ncbi:MAG: Rne/Rng family ribonuclease [Syntrophaceticus schinkii]|jgi:ribonuclease G|nr:Rne/Rng family ribonuclease [Syntrophaceticus schinkii]
MQKEIYIHVTKEETKAAVLEDRKLVEVYLDRSFQRRLAGNIYKGRVANVLPGMQAAFVNIGLERNAFLYVEDARPNSGRSLPIQNTVHEGQEILVQVVKEPFGTKGARVTTHLTFPGRYVVFMPEFNAVGVSRRIRSERERDRLKKIAEEVCIPGRGLIVRTAAEGTAAEELEQDVQEQYRLWKVVQKKAVHKSAPAVIHRELELVSWVLRDLFGEDVDRLTTNDQDTYEKILELVQAYAPHYSSRVFLTTSDFDDYELDQEINKALRPKVWLKSGGYLVIDEAEALTVIDVNTGKYTGTKNFAETIFRTNIEAIQEIVRQIRLRNLGGIIVIDFIDMELQEHRSEVTRQLEEELTKDKTRTCVLGLTQLGLVELTRKKVRPSLSSLLQRPCPYCEGTGRVLSEETVSMQACQEIRFLAEQERDTEGILVEMHPTVAAFLIGGGGSHLRELEDEIGKKIVIKGSDSSHLEEVQVKALHSREEIAALSAPVKTGEILEVEVEEAHATNPKDGIARIQGYIIDIEDGSDCIGQKVAIKIDKVYRTCARAHIIER